MIPLIDDIKTLEDTLLAAQNDRVVAEETPIDQADTDYITTTDGIHGTRIDGPIPGACDYHIVFRARTLRDRTGQLLEAPFSGPLMVQKRGTIVMVMDVSRNILVHTYHDMGHPTTGYGNGVHLKCAVQVNATRRDAAVRDHHPIALTQLVTPEWLAGKPVACEHFYGDKDGGKFTEGTYNDWWVLIGDRRVFDAEVEPLNALHDWAWITPDLIFDAMRKRYLNAHVHELLGNALLFHEQLKCTGRLPEE